MLDIDIYVENPDIVARHCASKGFTDYTDEILALDGVVRELKNTDPEQRPRKKIKITREIPRHRTRHR